MEKICVYIIVVAMNEFREVQDLKYKGEPVYVKTDAIEVSPIESSGSLMDIEDLSSPDLSSEVEVPAPEVPAPVVSPSQSEGVSQDFSSNTTSDSNGKITSPNSTGGKRRTRKSNRKTKRSNKKNKKSRTRR
jgi:hypothetical protein